MKRNNTDERSETLLFCREIFCCLSFPKSFANNFELILILLWINAVRYVIGQFSIEYP